MPKTSALPRSLSGEIPAEIPSCRTSMLSFIPALRNLSSIWSNLRFSSVKSSSGLILLSSVKVHVPGTTLKLVPHWQIPPNIKIEFTDSPGRMAYRVFLLSTVFLCLSRAFDNLTICSNALTPSFCMTTCTGFPFIVIDMVSAPRHAFHIVPLVGSGMSIPTQCSLLMYAFLNRYPVPALPPVSSSGTITRHTLPSS